MTAKWNSGPASAYPRAITGPAQKVPVAAGYLINGIDSACTHFYGAADPSTGAPVAWGADECGTVWIDIGVSGTADNPVWKVWRKLTSVPAYGWAVMYVQRVLHVVTDVDAIAETTTNADIAFGGAADVDLASALATLQTSLGGFNLATVYAVRLRLYTKITVAAHPTGLKCYFEVRGSGVTSRPTVPLCAQILSVPVYSEVYVPFGSNRILQAHVDTNAGGNTVAYGAKILDIFERH